MACHAIAITVVDGCCEITRHVPDVSDHEVPCRHEGLYMQQVD